MKIYRSDSKAIKIERNAKSVNFVLIPRSIYETQMPSNAKLVLIHLIGKSDDWKLKKTEISEELGLSANAVKNALTCLRNMGYVRVERTHTGHTKWFLYDDNQLNHNHNYV
jgi:transcription initiation factor IIE alpha subunit